MPYPALPQIQNFDRRNQWFSDIGWVGTRNPLTLCANSPGTVHFRGPRNEGCERCSSFGFTPQTVVSWHGTASESWFSEFPRDLLCGASTTPRPASDYVHASRLMSWRLCGKLLLTAGSFLDNVEELDCLRVGWPQINRMSQFPRADTGSWNGLILQSTPLPAPQFPCFPTDFQLQARSTLSKRWRKVLILCSYDPIMPIRSDTSSL